MKPQTLTQEEWEEIKKHSEIGYRIAESTPGLAHISKYILSYMNDGTDWVIHMDWRALQYPSFQG